MKFFKKLYLSDEISDENEIIEILEKGQVIYNLLLVCVNQNSDNLFEIFKVSEIFKNRDIYNNLIVVGMAYSREDAFNIIKIIFEEYIIKKKDIRYMKSNFIKNK